MIKITNESEEILYGKVDEKPAAANGLFDYIIIPGGELSLPFATFSRIEWILKASIHAA